MSIANLAARLDELDGHGAFVTEAENAVTVSNLVVVVAREILELTSRLGWIAQAYDGAGTPWAVDDLDEAYEPFRIELEKPAAAAGALRLLTNVGFVAWLERDDERPHWEVARLLVPIETHGQTFTPWDAAVEPAEAVAPTRSPRRLVREFSGQREVPASIERWLLRGRKDLPLEDAAVAVWVGAAARKLMLALPDEYDSETRSLRFKGPPRLDLAMPVPGEDIVAALGQAGWLALQDAVGWAFEIERETEMRHILLATELARCGGNGEIALPYLRANLADAHEAARTAYQVQLAGISSDALKTLAELRKSVTDETAKVADATRQIITAVAGALAVGVGLIAARLTTTTAPLVITLIMVIAGVYVAITILSGVMFTLLQRKVRAAWQPRLYRFLSGPDYKALVGAPARTAENALWLSSFLGGVAVILIAVVLWNVGPSTGSRVAQANQVDCDSTEVNLTDDEAKNLHASGATHIIDESVTKRAPGDSTALDGNHN